MKKWTIGLICFGILCIGIGIMFLLNQKEKQTDNIMQINLDIWVEEEKIKTINFDIDNNYQKITITEPNSTYEEKYFLDYDNQELYFLMDATYPKKTFSDMNISVNVLEIFDLISSAQTSVEVDDKTKEYTLDTDMTIAKITSANNLLNVLPSLKDFDHDNNIKAIVTEQEEKIQSIELAVDTIKLSFEISYDSSKRLEIPNS